MKKLFAFTFLVLTAAALLIQSLALVIADEHGRLVYVREVAIGERYTVRFIHSVERRPVDEVYEITPECSVLRETIYDMFGAGLPAEVESGQSFSVENGKFHICGFDLHIPVLTYRINKVVADHTLLIGTDQYPLKKWAGPGRALTFTIRRGSLCSILFWKLQSWYDKL